jgi:hypothetical protein
MYERYQGQITAALYALGHETAVPALILALEDPDVQMRRNSGVVLLDLAGGMSLGVEKKLDCREAIPALSKALTDSDESVRSWARQAIDEIRRSEIQ